MPSRPLRGGCWPTAEQTELLRAVLLRDRDVVRAWERWKQAADFERLDAGSSRLLGHLCRNLQRNGVTDPLLTTLKGFYRRTWYQNHLRLREAAVILARLRDRGIEPMLLKGAALVVLYYEDVGLRPMEDVDILVRTEQAEAAAATLSELGWTSTDAVTPRRLRASHAMAFTDSSGHQVDLHWHLLPESCWPDADARFWQYAAVVPVGGVEVRVLDTAHQLFHVCAHGVRWEPVPPLRWIADAATVMARAPSTIDWDRLLQEAERHRLTLPVRAALTYLARVLGLEVPWGILERLQRIRVSPSERLAHRWQTRPASRLLGRLPEHWLRYRRFRRGASGEPPISFVDYLEITFGCEGVRALSRRALLRHRWRRRSRLMVERYDRQLAGAGAADDRSPARS
jgi:hypothetical protein